MMGICVNQSMFILKIIQISERAFPKQSDFVIVIQLTLLHQLMQKGHPAVHSVSVMCVALCCRNKLSRKEKQPFLKSELKKTPNLLGLMRNLLLKNTAYCFDVRSLDFTTLWQNLPTRRNWFHFIFCTNVTSIWQTLQEGRDSGL